jgi:hypothetical protein
MQCSRTLFKQQTRKSFDTFVWCLGTDTAPNRCHPRHVGAWRGLRASGDRLVCVRVRYAPCISVALERRCAVACKNGHAFQEMQPTNVLKRDWPLVTLSTPPPPRFPQSPGANKPQVPYDAHSTLPSDQRSRAEGLGKQFLALLKFPQKPRRIPLSLPTPVTP